MTTGNDCPVSNPEKVTTKFHDIIQNRRLATICEAVDNNNWIPRRKKVHKYHTELVRLRECVP